MASSRHAGPCWPMLIWPSCVSTPSGGRGPRPRGRLAAPHGSRGAPAPLASRLGKAARSRSHPHLVELATTTPAARQTITLDPQNQNSSTPAVVLGVWMRNVLGTSDHLEGFGQSARIERRIVTGVGTGGRRAQAFLHDHLR